MNQTKYKIRVIRGAFINPVLLDDLGSVLIEKISDPNWQSIEALVVTLDQIKDLQKDMIKHYGNDTPWYLDGYDIENKNNMVVAFGSDDNEDGKIFKFNRSNREEISSIQSYGVLKGIPVQQMDFSEIDF